MKRNQSTHSIASSSVNSPRPPISFRHPRQSPAIGIQQPNSHNIFPSLNHPSSTLNNATTASQPVKLPTGHFDFHEVIFEDEYSSGLTGGAHGHYPTPSSTAIHNPSMASINRLFFTGDDDYHQPFIMPELTRDSSNYKYQQEISAMMYTFGEVRHPQPETLVLMEDIVHAQIQEMLLGASHIARRRGAKSNFSHEDIIFLIRRDRMKVARLTTYLSWRKVRKIANRTGASGGAGGSNGGTSTGNSGGGDLLDEDLEEGGVVAESGEKKIKKQKIKLSWNQMDQFDDVIGSAGNEGDDSDDADDDDEVVDEDEREFFRAMRRRLKMADRITMNMSKDEYMDYAECRQASFTYKKPSRFRDWLRIEQITGMKANNDMLDILGFLCYEMVRTLTEQSLAVKSETENQLSKFYLNSGNDGGGRREYYVEDPYQLDNDICALRERYQPYSIFSSPNARTPIRPVHLMEAYRRLQLNEQQIPYFTDEGTCYYETASVRTDLKESFQIMCGSMGIRNKRNLI